METKKQKISEAPVYNTKGEIVGMTHLSEDVFGLSWNGALVSQALDAERSLQRKNIAHTKGRGEVRGGGKKPWRQKGTGRARHGSIRSPLWVGGGVTHGPTKERIYAKKINKKMRRKALFTVLSAKARESELILLDSFSFSEGKTRRTAEAFRALRTGTGMEKLGHTGGTALIALPGKDTATVQAVRNLSHVKVCEARNLHVGEVLSHKFLVLPKDSLDVVEQVFIRGKNMAEPSA